MKLKKALIMALCLVLGAAIAIGGTVAYFTDRESRVNVFTVGNVSIELNENFEQGAELLPGVRVQKEATITNVGENDAWVWMTVALPAVLDDENAELGSANVLHWNMPGCFWNGYHDDEKYIKSGIADGYLPEGSSGVAAEDSWINDNKPFKETVNGIVYNVYTFKYVGTIVPGETTNIGLSRVFLDENIDIDTDGQWYNVENGAVTKINWNSKTNGTPKVYVSAYAIQENGFADVNAAYAAYKAQWGDNGTEYAAEDEKESAEAITVNAANIASVDFTQDNATFKFSGTFTEDVAIEIPEGLTQTFDASGAVFNGNVVLSRGVAASASGLDAERKGNLKITGFEAVTLNVSAINMESVSITDNKVCALSVAGGNLELIIDGNTVNGNQSSYTTDNSEHSKNEYGISLRITDYELSVTDNVITDAYSHAIGINGRQDEGGTEGWIDRGANNTIKAFSGNTITVNSTKKTSRAALKMWNDRVYAPYATSGNEPNANATALMDAIKADTTNVFNIGEGHSTFNIYDYKVN